MKAIATIILAAGKGTRMKTDLPKVLYPIDGKAMIRYVLDTVTEIGIQKSVIVVGYHADQVKSEIAYFPTNFVIQEPQNGTGHAVLQAEPLLEDFKCDIIVLYGDVPFIRPETLERVIRTHQRENAAATILTVDMPDPTRYGRIVREKDGSVIRIVEHTDATDEELKISEINTGIICFRNPGLFDALHQVTPNNQQGELYLTDVIDILRQNGQRISAVKAGNPFEVMGIDDQEKAAQAENMLSLDRIA